MTPWLQTALTVVSLLVALLAVVYVVRDRPIDRLLLAAMAVLWLGCLLQLVTGVVNLARTDEDVSGVLFVAYLVGLVAVPPLAVAWARGEPSRAGTGVLVLAGVLVPFLLLRLHAIWIAPGV